jgi:hypothetical protein
MIQRFLSLVFLGATALLLVAQHQQHPTTVRAFVAVPVVHNKSSKNNCYLTRTRATTTVLSERRWNFNEGQSPWGLKKNAEIWNGRLAQVRIVVVCAAVPALT